MSVSSRSSTSVFCRCSPGGFFGGGVDTGVIAAETAAPVRREEPIGLGRSWDDAVGENEDGKGSGGSVMVAISVMVAVMDTMAWLILGVGGVRSIVGVPLRLRSAGPSGSKSGVGVTRSRGRETG